MLVVPLAFCFLVFAFVAPACALGYVLFSRLLRPGVSVLGDVTSGSRLAVATYLAMCGVSSALVLALHGLASIDGASLFKLAWCACAFGTPVLVEALAWRQRRVVVSGGDVPAWLVVDSGALAVTRAQTWLVGIVFLPILFEDASRMLP